MKISETVQEYILAGISDRKELGIELEHFVCDEENRTASYETVADSMKEAASLRHWKLQYVDGFVLGVECGDYWVSLEPAGQLEISITPQQEIEKIGAIYREFRRMWDGLLARRGYHFVTKGVNPLVEKNVLSPDDIPMIPKRRYAYMDEYFKSTGKYGRYMMRATASLQVSIDYASPKDAVRKLRLLEILSPLLSLLLENRSCASQSGIWKKHLLRMQIWGDLDADRCGYVPHSLDEDFSIREYSGEICKKPMIVMDTGKEVLPTKESADTVFKRHIVTDGGRFTEYLLSMFFYHIRIKKYIEIRIADSVPEKTMLGYAALMKGLMYSEESLAALEELFQDVRTLSEITAAEDAVMDEGYQAVAYGMEAEELLCRIWEIAYAGLSEEKERTYLRGVLTLPVLERFYRDCVDVSDAEHRESQLRAREYILHSTARYHGRFVRSLYVPKLFTEKEIALFQEVAAVMSGIFGKVIREYRENASYRALFGFGEMTTRMILRDAGYRCPVPIARIDLFYREDTGQFKFCEFNTDGTSAMNEDRELNTALKETKAYRLFCERFSAKSFELFDSWTEEFLTIYAEFAAGKGRGPLPRVAIVDFMDLGTTNEFEIFRQAFERRGISCEVCDIRELKWDGQRLCSLSGMEIDAIYRRAVTGDIEKNYKAIPDFIAAVQAGGVCLIGDFQTQIVHHKKFFEILRHPFTKKILSERENQFVEEHVPLSAMLTKELLKEEKLRQALFSQKDNWIIKPQDSYGSKGVLAGVECEAEKWTAYVEECVDKGYVLQEFYEPYQLPNIDLKESDEWRMTSNLTGLYVYGGKFRGVYSRISYGKMISTQYNEMALPTIVVS